MVWYLNWLRGSSEQRSLDSAFARGRHTHRSDASSFDPSAFRRYANQTDSQNENYNREREKMLRHINTYQICSFVFIQSHWNCNCINFLLPFCSRKEGDKTGELSLANPLSGINGPCFFLSFSFFRDANSNSSIPMLIMQLSKPKQSQAKSVALPHFGFTNTPKRPTRRRLQIAKRLRQKFKTRHVFPKEFFSLRRE